MIKKKYAGLADMELPACPCGIVRRTEWIDDQDGERLRLTICQPEESMDNMPCLVYFHGGGFCLGDAPYIHENVAQYAKEANCMVVFVHYRTSDRYPFPVPFMDCYTALEYIREHCEPWHIDRKRIAVGGDSAGGGLCYPEQGVRKDGYLLSDAGLPCYGCTNADRINEEIYRQSDLECASDKANVGNLFKKRGYGQEMLCVPAGSRRFPEASACICGGGAV